MAYTLFETPAAHKLFKKFPPQVRRHLYDSLQTLKDNPHAGEQLTGTLRAFRSFHTKINNIHYRVLYQIDEAQEQIIIRLVGVRENFYKRAEAMKLRAVK